MTTKVFRVFSFAVVLFVAQAIFAADFQVNQTNDTGDGTCDATCTLRDAILAANGAAGDDSISFSYAVFNVGATITVSGTDILIANNGALAINGFDNEKIIINGMNNGRILTTSTGGVVTIRDVSFTGGNGVSTVSSGRGGALYNNGANLTINGVRVFNNTAVNGGGLNTSGNGTTNIINCEIFNNIALTSSGGGLQNFSGSTTNVVGSTFRGNTSNSDTGGGAIQSAGFTNITNSTFTGNRAVDGAGGAVGGNGGAITYGGGGMIMTNTTIVGNTADNLSGGFHKSTTNVNTTIRNNIIAGNIGTANSADIQGNFMSQGFNLIQAPGTTTGLIASDITGMPALTTPVGYYGGLTSTQALLSGSLAIDGGDNCVVDLSCMTGNPPVAIPFDQRGAVRPSGMAVDIGSFESSASYVAELDEGAIGAIYNEQITPMTGSFSYTLVGSLPPGLNVLQNRNSKGSDGSTGAFSIQGTPTTLGTYNFGIMISSGMNSTTINYRIVIAPTTLTGQLLDGSGNPVSGAFVSVTDGMMNVQTTQTSIDGTYNFTNVTAGATYTVSFRSRRNAFRSESIVIVAGTNTVDPIVQ